MTILELTLTLGLLLLFSSVVFLSANGIANWKLARVAGEELRAVYLAQKNYLADHPMSEASAISEEELVLYLPGNRTGLPVLESLEKEDLTIEFNVIPPLLYSGAQVYDPSGSATDGLWDAGVR